MAADARLDRFFNALIRGDRPQSRRIMREAMKEAKDPRDLVRSLFWPTYEQIERLYRSDQLSKLAHHAGTRFLRVLIDQTSGLYELAPSNGRSVLAFCGPRDSDELGAQLAVDLLEAEGFQITFAGGGIPNDEILAQIHDTRPQVVLLFAAGSTDLPQLRQLIDTLHDIGACPNIQIVVGGGVFNRADGLAEEIGADLCAPDPLSLVDVMSNKADVRGQLETRTVGRKKVKKAA